MKTRYVAIPASRKPRASYWDGDIGLIHMPDSVTVIEQEDSPLETGLLNAHGTPLYRVAERLPIGFHTK